MISELVIHVLNYLIYRVCILIIRIKVIERVETSIPVFPCVIQNTQGYRVSHLRGEHQL